MRRALILAAALVVAPVSLAAIIVWWAAPIVDAGMFFLETMAKAQIAALLILSPIILATKLHGWLKMRGII